MNRIQIFITYNQEWLKALCSGQCSPIFILDLFKKDVNNDGFDVKGFADDHQLYTSFISAFHYHCLAAKLKCIRNNNNA